MFGAEAAALLVLVAEVDAATPVLFVDTVRLFGETRRYRETLTKALKLSDVRVVGPDPQHMCRTDPADCCGVTTRTPAASCARCNRWRRR